MLGVDLDLRDGDALHVGRDLVKGARHPVHDLGDLLDAGGAGRVRVLVFGRGRIRGQGGGAGKGGRERGEGGALEGASLHAGLPEYRISSRMRWSRRRWAVS